MKMFDPYYVKPNLAPPRQSCACIFGSATIHATQWIINASYNQRQQIFFVLTTAVVITEGKVRAPNTGSVRERQTGTGLIFGYFKQ
jgi:hypothetical protein